MIRYDGIPPAPDEIEVTLFGRGFGEALAVHLGDGAWLLADSCTCPDTKRPVAADYLDQLGVASQQVRAIVATHWHDDHVRGISSLAEKYSTAQFVLSSIFSNLEASTYLAAYSGTASSGQSRGTKELYTVVKARPVVHAHHRSIVFQGTTQGRPVLVTALSPVQQAYAQSSARLASYLPTTNAAITHAPAELKTNIASIALHIDLDDDAVLLGADLEDHHSYGWTAVVRDSWSGSLRPATAYKVAHHGGLSGDCPELWKQLLVPNPDICLTPYSLGKHRLPTEEDKSRLRTRPRQRFICAGASRRPLMDSEQLNRLSDVCEDVRCLEGMLGAVRLRKRPGDKVWNATLFGAAQSF